MRNLQQVEWEIYNNTAMLTEDEIYKLLGIAPDTGADDLTRAYHKAVLIYHPDCCPDDPEAAGRFHRITQVYQAALNFRRKGLAGHKITPQELAMENWAKPRSVFVQVEPGSDMSWLNWFGGRRFSLPTKNENLLFVCFWAVSMIIAFLSVYLMGDIFLAERSRGSFSALDVVIFASVPLGIYAASVTAVIIAIVLTRQIVYIVSQFRLVCQRALPSGRADATELADK